MWEALPRNGDVVLRTQTVVPIASKEPPRPLGHASDELRRRSQVLGASSEDLPKRADVVESASSSLKTAPDLLVS
jgi:hypothetical protein